MANKKVHRNTDPRICGASTVVAGQSTVFANNNLLVSVNADPNSHGGGALNASSNKVYCENKLVVIHRADSAAPDSLCPIPPIHCAPSTAGGSPDVFAGEG